MFFEQFYIFNFYSALLFKLYLRVWLFLRIVVFHRNCIYVFIRKRRDWYKHNDNCYTIPSHHLKWNLLWPLLKYASQQTVSVSFANQWKFHGICWSHVFNWMKRLFKLINLNHSTKLKFHLRRSWGALGFLVKITSAVLPEMKKVYTV